MPSIPVSQKKRGRPATGETPRVGVRMEPELTEGLDAFSADEPDNPSRSEAIRRIIRDWLRQRGYLKQEGEHER